jgi:hypothetical protein
MKKLAMLLIGIAFLSACKKDYTCECTFLVFSQKTVIKNATKRQAKANCISESMTVPDSTGTGSIKIETNCTLK